MNVEHIFVVRHGNYSADYPNSLNENGKYEAQKLGRIIKDFHYKDKRPFTRVFSSTLRRNIETATIIADEFLAGTDIYTTENLERNAEAFYNNFKDNVNTLLLVGNIQFVKGFPLIVKEKIFGEKVTEENCSYRYCEGIYFDIKNKKYLSIPSELI